MVKTGFLAVIFIVMLLMFACAGCITPPPPEEQIISGGSPDGQDSQSGSATAAPVSTTAVFDTAYITQATPYSTGTPPTTRPTFSPDPNFTQQVTLYKVIYFNSLDFKYNVTAYTATVSRAPLIIEMCLSPNIVTRNIWYESRYESKEDVYTTQTYISPSSFFEIQVRDKGSGEIIAREGFGKTYSVNKKKELQIRASGVYLIEFSGNDIVATVQMSVPMEPGENVTPSGTLSCPS